MYILATPGYQEPFYFQSTSQNKIYQDFLISKIQGEFFLCKEAKKKTAILTNDYSAKPPTMCLG